MDKKTSLHIINSSIEYASFNRRMIAASIDVFLITIIITPLINLIHYFVYNGSSPSEILNIIASESNNENLDYNQIFDYLLNKFKTKFILIQIFELLFIGTVTLFFWYKFDSTLGKIITKCKIVDFQTHKKPSFKQYLLRFFGYILSSIPPFIGFFMIGITRNRRGLHDYIANTAVIITKPSKQLLKK